LAIRGAASQAADLQKWQNSSGTDLARMFSNGTLVVPTIYSNNYYNSGSSALSALILETTGGRITTATATNIALKAQTTAVSPTGDLFQALVGTTVVAKIDVNGKLSATSIFGGTP
jgi:hypothetical protein